MATKSSELAQRIADERIESFAQRYGDKALDFAAHCAFPLTLTTELTYCLRERFSPDLDWSIAPQLLLSVLCDEVGHDLYGMDIAVRGALLIHLIENCGKQRLDELADFMAEYIAAGLATERNYRSRVFGNPPAIIKFTALSLLKQGSELRVIIERELQDLLRQTTNPRDRLQLAMFVENQDNLLASMGFTSMLPGLAQSIADDISSDELGRVKEVMKQHNFPVLQQQIVKYAKVSFAKNTVDTGDTLYSFEFETVIVDAASKIVARNQREAFAFREPLENGIELEMVAIPSGKFMMGGSEEDPDSKHRGTLTMGGSRGDLDNKDREYPQHEVILQPFYIGRYPVTQSQWQAVAAYSPINLEISLNPSRFEGKNLPVEWVSWDEAQEFCKRLSARTGRNYCLPSEAQWEYACRSGSETAFHYGRNTSLHLFNCRSGCTTINGKDCLLFSKTSEVGIFPANNWGLHDMHGNVWEWCKDNWHSTYSDAPNDGSAWVEENCDDKRVIRGGSWNQEADRCRSSHRGYYSLSDHLSSLTRSAPQGPRSDTGTTIGFRVCCIP